MKSVILAGGEGEGLQPYTVKRQKETISILGKAIIEYVVEGLRKAGVKEFVIVTNKDKQYQVDEVLSNMKDISYEMVIQKNKGISGAVKDGLEKIDNEYSLIAYGDIITSEDFYVSLMNAYLSSGDKSIFPLVPVSEGLSTYGLVKIEDNRLKLVSEGSTLALAGAYIIKQDDFNDILSYIEGLFQKDMARYFVWSGLWLDIGYPEDLIRAVEVLLSHRRGSYISENAEISKTAVLGKDIIIEDNAVIEDYSIIKGPAYIGKNAYVGSYALIRDYSDLEEGSRTGAYCEIAHSIIGKYAEVNSKSYLTYSVVGDKAKIGASVVTMSYPYKTVRGRVNKMGSLISPFSEIEAGKILQPGFRI